jgi:catechol 2,3-dioxygenase-like lactoylglutathione lyase family enzyme
MPADSRMTPRIDHISAISLFVEDLQASKAFYLEIFDVKVIYEDESAVTVQFANLIINLLHVDNAPEIIEPGIVAPRDSGSRFQLSVWVEDVDAVCRALKARGVTLLAGPKNRPWGKRTANFVDPAGHSWEVGQILDSK